MSLNEDELLAHCTEVGSIVTELGRTLHIYSCVGDDRPFVLGVSGQGRRPFLVSLTAPEMERLLTLLDESGRHGTPAPQELA